MNPAEPRWRPCFAPTFAEASAGMKATQSEFAHFVLCSRCSFEWMNSHSSYDVWGCVYGFPL